ncbi:phage baseplate assembly protein [Acinetobacter guerrae]|uniref:phage baseplate assembly protein n=1 Tax=Acinetobacter guerrae TaxID=1843371 RepID=UPI00128B1AFA|nr:contractile injection system protein, VgrG/Pvc8 family [Acinetobacter guerrae]MPW44738.1 hypothetical protein [Acinetobacter guerrae]
MKSNIVSLKVASGSDELIVTGWNRLSITRGIERIPNNFDLQMTDKSPNSSAPSVVINEGSKCRVYIGDDLVITGYVDRVINNISDNQHVIQVVGRGICSDLVDCSAVYKGMQFQNCTVQSIAESLCEDFGITVTSNIDANDVVSVQNINLGETPAAVIDRVCRVAQVLYYENEYGNLVLNRENSETASGSLTQGSNVESASFVSGMDQRYSHYIVVNQAAAAAMDIPSDSGIGYYTVPDPTVPRYRPLYIIPEDGDAGFEVAQKRAQWEMNRRYGRSNMLRATVSSWRDYNDVLYKPNTQIQVNILKLGLFAKNWLIGEVTYRLDEMGTHCDMLIMPLGSFTPEPVVPVKGLPTDVLNANQGITT